MGKGKNEPWNTAMMISVPADQIPLVVELKEHYSVATMEKIPRYEVQAMILWHRFRVRLLYLKRPKQRKIAWELLQGTDLGALAKKFGVPYSTVTRTALKVCDVMNAHSVSDYQCKFGFMRYLVSEEELEEWFSENNR